MPIIQVKDGYKTFGTFTAVAGVDLEVEEGECFGLLGPNGAGKTTLVRMIIGVSPITHGTICVDGKSIVKNPRQIKARLGVVPQEDNLDPDLNVMQNLLNFARYFDIPAREAKARALSDLAFFELQMKHKAKIEELSGGMKRRLLIARGLINRPRLLILDEPSVGLDPTTKHLMWQKIRSLQKQGMTLLLTTQNMEEAWRLCDRVAVMNDGRIIALGTPQELLGRYGGSQVYEARPLDEAVPVQEKLDSLGLKWERIEDTFYIFQENGQVLDDDLKKHLIIVDQHVPTLEDVFLRLTGRSIEQ